MEGTWSEMHWAPVDHVPNHLDLFYNKGDDHTDDDMSMTSLGGGTSGDGVRVVPASTDFGPDHPMMMQNFHWNPNDGAPIDSDNNGENGHGHGHMGF